MDAGNRSLLYLTQLLGMKGAGIRIQKCFKEPEAGHARTQEAGSPQVSRSQAVPLGPGPPSLCDERADSCLQLPQVL